MVEQREGAPHVSKLRPLPRDPAGDHEPAIVTARRNDLSAQTNVSLAHIGGLPVPTTAAARQVEGMIGFAAVPVGVAGPLVLRGEFELETFVPFATTEGTMIASFGRGMKLLRAAGGAHAWVMKDGLTYHPSFTFDSTADAIAAFGWIEAQLPLLTAAANATSSHGRLLSIRPVVSGRTVVLRCRFRTGEAHGINIASRAAEAMRKLIVQQTACPMPHGTESLEKRGSVHDLIEGRGKHVITEVIIPAGEIEQQLRTTPQAMVSLLHRYKSGFQRVGVSVSFHLQAHNAITAVYIACGQDVAYAAEAAAGELEFKLSPAGDLHVIADYPAMMTATIGGGTGAGTAKESLELMGCTGPGSARRLACILGATCMAGELSFVASLLTNELVQAHARLGRPGANQG
jgi:hydroxymethylglutaryl-CoA reductase (NADPH)